jgi:hypothetical protein
MEEDEQHRTDLDQPEWQEVLAEDGLRSMRMYRFRGILKRQKLIDIAKIYTIVAQDVRMRIMLHLNESDHHTLIYILKSSKLHEFANNIEERKSFMILLGFEVMLTVT